MEMQTLQGLRISHQQLTLPQQPGVGEVEVYLMKEVPGQWGWNVTGGGPWAQVITHWVKREIEGTVLGSGALHPFPLLKPHPHSPTALPLHHPRATQPLSSCYSDQHQALSLCLTFILSSKPHDKPVQCV